ncbi:MAG: LytTR family DNA-binding domain-containing protein [Bacteroidota bacterium]
MKIAIIDDEKHLIDRTCDVVKQHFPSFEIVGTAGTVEDAINLIANTQPNIVLLDIHLSDGTGFDLIQRLFPINFKIIFITAHEQFAIKAFKFSALDYILKPFDDIDLVDAINRASSQLQKESSDVNIEALLSNIKTGTKEVKKIVLKTNDSIYVVRVNEIIRLESDGAYTQFFFLDGKKVLVSKNLKEFEDILCDYGFFRIHQSHLINTEFLIRYQKGDGGFVIMKDGSMPPVSVRKKEQLINYLNNL